MHGQCVVAGVNWQDLVNTSWLMAAGGRAAVRHVDHLLVALALIAAIINVTSSEERI